MKWNVAKKQEASYTVELALLLPVFLLALFLPVHMGYRLYEQTRVVSVSGWDASLDAEKRVRQLVWAEELLHF